MIHDVVIVGAGIAGLTLAYRLRQRRPDWSIQIVEAAERVGGKIETVRQAGYLLEAGPHAFLDNRPSTLDLCDDLGLTAELIRADAGAGRRFVYLGDRLQRLPTGPISFLTSPILSLAGRWRFLKEWTIPAKTDLADESIHAFAERRFGIETAGKLAATMVTGILAGDPKRLSLPACFPRIEQLEREHGSILRSMFRRQKPDPDRSPRPRRAPQLTSFVGGMGRLVERLGDRLRDHIRCQVVVQQLTRSDEVWELQTSVCPVSSRQVVLACPVEPQFRLLQSTSPRLAELVGGIPSVPAVVACLGYRRDQLPTTPRGFGYLAPIQLGRPVLGVIWSSCVFAEQAPSDHFQFRAIMGGAGHPEIVNWTDEQLIETVRTDLRSTLGISALPEFSWIRRWSAAIPQYHLGHRDRLQQIETALSAHPGLYLAGSPYRGVAVNDLIADAEPLAESITGYFRKNSETTF